MPTETAVRERPILFSGPMVRAILDGRKTQTRRVLHEQPVAGPLPGGKYEASDPWVGEDGIWRFMRGVVSHEWDDVGRCPYGQPGDRLWVREGFVRHISIPELVGYVADGCEVTERWERRFPSIHMPRRFSRITLEITDVRVERVQELSEEDAQAEGVTQEPVFPGSRVLLWRGTPGGNLCSHAAGAFQHLWDSLNGPRGYGWDANPWVWVVSFRRVEVAHG